MSEDSLPPPRHEAKDISPRILLPLAGCMIGMAIFALAATWWKYPAALRTQDVTDPAASFPAPRLQPRPAADMAQFRAQETAALNSYGWVDREHGIVHVPIEQAMRNLAEHGIPGWPAERGK